ncbi:MAG: hypothetical protein AB8F78_02510 [Saprospiraceae bacterium]
MPYGTVFPFAFVFAGDSNGIDVVAHPHGYTGTGGALTINIGIDITSVNAADMAIPVQNVVNTFNALSSTVGNIATGAANNVPFSEYDFESVLLHEMGHSLGLAHCNIGFSSANPSGIEEFSNSTNGPDNTYDTNNGADNIDGTADDLRDDDVNLNYFKISDNDPFSLAGTFDNSTYSRDIAVLPGTDSYSENASLQAGPGLSEAALQQGSPNGQAQRELHPDDEAGLRYAMSGLDEIQGNSDDYTITLNYVGEVTAASGSADILIDFDSGQTGFAVSQSGGTFVSADHVSITTNSIFFHPTVVTWFFNNVPLPVSLVSFDAEIQDNVVNLSWKTASEIDHSHFEVERTQDLQNWKVIANVTDHNEELQNGAKNYSATDKEVALLGGDWYYRLIAVSNDGQRAPSRLQHVSVVPSKLNLRVGPIPLVSSSCAELELDVPATVNYRIIDEAGRILIADSFSGQIGSNEIDISAAIQPGHGVHFLTVEAGGHQVVKRLIR